MGTSSNYTRGGRPRFSGRQAAEEQSGKKVERMRTHAGRNRLSKVTPEDQNNDLDSSQNKSVNKSHHGKSKSKMPTLPVEIDSDGSPKQRRHLKAGATFDLGPKPGDKRRSLAASEDRRKKKARS